MKKNIIAIYVRVSTEEQMLERNSIYNQIDKLKTRAIELGYLKDDIVIYNDEGESSKDSRRPNYVKLIKDIEDNKVCALLFLRLDRVNRDITEGLRFLKICKDNNVDLYDVNEHIDMNDLNKELTVLIMMVVANNEQKLISKRTREAYEGAFKLGKYPIARIPIGYKRDKDKKLVFDNDNKELVKSIIGDYVNTTLTQLQLVKKYKLHHTTIARILNNDIYSGKVIYNGIEYNVTNDIYINDEVRISINNKLDILKRIRNNVYLWLFAV